MKDYDSRVCPLDGRGLEVGEGQWGSASPWAQLLVGRSTLLAMPLQDYLPQNARLLLLCRGPGQPGQNLHSLGLRKGGVSWAGLGGIWDQPALGGLWEQCQSQAASARLRSPAQLVGQTGRARLSLNGTLLRLHLCQLGRVGADKCYFGI